jgi:transcriptional regulator with XRE-family HTH domain
MELYELQKKIGYEIKKLRIANGWTQEEAADHLHLCRKAYGEIERGETDIHLSRLWQLAHNFGVDIDYFIDSKEKSVFYVTGSLNSLFNNKNSNNQCLIQATDKSVLHYELEKSQLIIEQDKREIIALQQKVVDLQKIIQLLETINRK